jgi:hypothetical protein
LFAKAGDLVDTGCGSCFLLPSEHGVSLGVNVGCSLNVGSGISFGNGVNINQALFSPRPVVKKFDEQVRLKTPQGKLIPNQPYFISTVQRTYQGISDSNGCLPRIPTNEKEEIRIYLGVLALEKWV